MVGRKPRCWDFDREEFAFDFAPFGPDGRALFDLVRAEIDDATLREIAEADYGDRSDEHFAELDAMRSTGEIPLEMNWVPRETLELKSHHEPDDPAFMPQCRHGDAGHRMRLFCVVALLQNAGEGGDGWTGGENVAFATFESSLRLGPNYVDAGLRFFAWLGEQFPPRDSTRVMAALSLATLWPYSSIAASTDGTFKRLVERLYGPPAPSGLDWFIDSCRRRPHWQSSLDAAAGEATRLADGRVISRRCAMRFSKLVERVRAADDPFPRMRERRVRFGERDFDED